MDRFANEKKSIKFLLKYKLNCTHKEFILFLCFINKFKLHN